ncbi:TPA: phage tail protein [Serratia fonticola]
MAAKYFTVITHKGTDLIADAIINDKKLAITEMAVGDTSGAPWSPLPTQTALINERYRTKLNQVFIDPKNPNQIIAECIIPENTGGWWIREAGLFDTSGNLVAVANCPDTYKPILAQGSGRNSILRMVLIVSEVAAIELKIDPTTVMATRAYVDEQIIILGNSVSESLNKMDEQITVLGSTTAENLRKHEQSRNHPDATLLEKGFTKLNSAIDSIDETTAATPKAVKDAYDLAASKATLDIIYPVGIVAWLAVNKNPNTTWPGTTWIYLGENKTIRLAKQDGTDVRQTGGSDTITIARSNLPPEKLTLTGDASEVNLGPLTTRPAGKHKHGGVPLRDSAWEVGGVNRVLFSPINQGETDEAPDHSHLVDIPPHKHTVAGSTENLGQGQPINIVNSYIKLMAWYRTA